MLDIKAKHDMSCLTLASLQQFAECMCTRKTAAADDVQESLQFILLTAGCMVLSMLGVSMGGILFLRINSGSLCVMPTHFMMSHLKRCLSSYIFHADFNTVTGMQSVDLWQTHMLF